MSEPQPSNWPVFGYVAAVVFGWLSCQCLGARLSSIWAAVWYEIVAVQTFIAALFLARLALARIRRERNGVWKVYITASIPALPLWEIIYGMAVGLTEPS